MDVYTNKDRTKDINDLNDIFKELERVKEKNKLPYYKINDEIFKGIVSTYQRITFNIITGTAIGDIG